MFPRHKEYLFNKTQRRHDLHLLLPQTIEELNQYLNTVNDLIVQRGEAIVEKLSTIQEGKGA